MMLEYLITDCRYPDFDKGEFCSGNIGIREGKIDYIGEGEPVRKRLSMREGISCPPDS